jgi:hypothetical protein
MGLFGGSKSSTSNLTENTTNNLQTESGIQIVDSAGASVVMTDHDAVELSFNAIEEISRDSFDFARDVGRDSLDIASKITDKSFAFVGDALEGASRANERATEEIGNANERIEVINNKTIGTIKDFAENLKMGDLKTTKTIYLAGAGLIAAVVVSAVVVTGISASNNRKAGK